MTARLRGFLPSELNDAQLEVYNAIAGGPRAGGPFALTNSDGSLRGPFNAMVLSPAIGLTLQAVGAAVRYKSTLTDRARELAILVVAAHWGSAFEREAHEAVGRACGLSEAELTDVRRGERPNLVDRAERIAMQTTAALAAQGALTDDEYQAAVEAIGERGVFELTALVGYYATLALQLRVFAGESGNRE